MNVIFVELKASHEADEKSKAIIIMNSTNTVSLPEVISWKR